MSYRKTVTINDSDPVIIEGDGRIIKPERKRTESGGSGTRRRRGYHTQISYHSQTSECSLYSETGGQICSSLGWVEGVGLADWSGS